ncbi:MAG: ABC-F family ATP-binding cassette domain-containing protein [Candidatus Eisenbacteria bacterium]|nr:ABC-F family ATP-binding cassette domain-containing protein [Candidatus Eisenbacteria bacterium]
MIQLQDLAYSIGERVLFAGLDWVLAPGDRVALVGPNGAGKTTLLRVMLGELRPESGARVLARGTRMGYLPQEAAERYDGTVLERAMEAHRHLLEMREELDALHQRLSGISPDDPHLERLLERAGEIQHLLELHDEHALEPEARRVLSGLGFPRGDQDRPLAEFSGGWRMRAALAALLLTDPTLLFLDEPTNHLDLPAMEWIEDYLEDFHGGLVVVSHDRVFLDRVASEVRELDAGKLTGFATTFTGYLEERELRRERVEAQNEQLEKRIASLSRFVERFGAKNTKASQAQSKRKLIERLRAQRVVLPRRPKSIRFQFPEPPHAGRALVRLRGLSFGYAARDVIAGADLEVERGEKLAIVGANGAGKTTLLRLVAGQLAPRAGTREDYPHTRLAYFAQHAAETLDGAHTALESLEDVAPPPWRPRLRSLLGTFLFSGDDVFKLVRVLSGGERQRVALARILMEPANLLLLDEPTHHLDLAGKEVLEDALDQYPGAVVVVTHDRSLMARLATRVVEVSDGRVTLYPGGYDDYEAARLARAAAERGGGAPAKPALRPARPTPRTAGAGAPTPGAARPAPAARGESRAERAGRQKRERELQRIEKDIETREGKMRELETRLADPDVYHDGARAKELIAGYERLRAEVESLWQRLAEL